MDWHASGITNEFEYELLDRSLSHTGWLDNVTGGTIEQSYRGDYRVTASLELDGDIPAVNGYVRIWHVATLGGETVRTRLATLAPELPGMEYRLGRWNGSLDLYSAMKKMDTSEWTKDTAIAGTVAAASKFKDIAYAAGVISYVAPGISATKTIGKSLVAEFGTPVLSTCHTLADIVTGYIGVDDAGRVCLVPYALPSKRSASWSLDSGIESVMLIGVQREEPEPYNCVSARYETDGKTYYSTKVLPPSHPWSFDSLWRRVSRSIEVDAVSSPIQSNLDKLAANELASLSDTSARYEVRALFHPDIAPGTVGDVRYSDSPDDPGLSFRAFCSQREIELDAAMTMTLTLEEI